MVHHRVVVDTDPGLDDALALQYLTRHPAVEILGVGSVHGNVPAHAAANNALRLLELVNDTETPVVVGAEEPLAQPLQLGQPSDEFGALAGAPRRQPAEASAADLIVQTARAMPGEVSLLALGPLTNVALALTKEPDLPHLLGRVVMMGGAITGAGNATAFAESNIAHDPEAAERVITAGFELTMVGLDVTRSATASPTWVRAIAADPLWGEFARHVLTQYGDDLPPLPLHDPLTVRLVTGCDVWRLPRTATSASPTTSPRSGWA